MSDDGSRSLFVLEAPFQHDGGFGYRASLAESLRPLCDGIPHAPPSPLVLYEDGEPLTRARALHADIRALGAGRFSFWSGTLYFSASDNSDPNLSGRRYSVGQLDRAPAPPKTAPAAIVAAAAPKTGSAKPVRVGLIGCGQRAHSIARQFHDMEAVEIDAYCDVDPLKRAALSERWRLQGARALDDWRSLVEDASLDALFILTPDHTHRDIAVAAFEAGKHVFLEKPIATTLEDGRAVVDAWVMSGRMLAVGTVLREAGFYKAVKEALRSGEVGRVTTLTLSEQLGLAHGASFMRRWHRVAAQSGGLIVHKGSHDLDLACWLLDDVPARVSSFGGRRIFAREAPAEFCVDCPEAPTCDYRDKSAYEYRAPEQSADPKTFGMGRCVYDPSSEIVDHQVAAFELAGGVCGAFTLSTNGPGGSRRSIVVTGEKGRLEGVFEDGTFSVHPSDGGPARVWSAAYAEEGHGGGDKGTLQGFLARCRGDLPPILTPASVLAGFALATGSERARLEGRVVEFEPELFG